MAGEQLDLFAGTYPAVEPLARAEEAAPDPATLTDDALIAALPIATLTTSPILAAEAARRRLAAAVPALERLCRRLIGYGAERIVPEQAAALQALAVIDGSDARQAVVRMIVDRVVLGPTLGLALDSSARLGAPLPPTCLTELLRHPDPSIRTAACRCAQSPAPTVIAALVPLLDDLHTPVAAAAVCALGRLGRAEAQPLLIRLLREAPSAEIIEAVVPIADRDTIVILRRIARTMPDLTAATQATLDELMA